MNINKLSMAKFKTVIRSLNSIFVTWQAWHLAEDQGVLASGGSGPKILTMVEYFFLLGLGQPPLCLEISPKNPKFFYFFPQRR